MLTRKERALLTHKKIMDASLEQFSNHGYANTTMEQIADTAGVAKGSVFKHFSSKLQLGFAVVELQAKQYIDAIQSALDQGQPIAMVLEEVFFGAEPQANDCYTLTHLLFSLLMEKKTQVEKQKFVDLSRTSLGPVYEQLASIFEQLGISNPLLTSRVFIAILDGLALQLSIEEMEDDTELIKQLYGVVKQMLGLDKLGGIQIE